MTSEDRPSWLMSNVDNRRRHYEQMCKDHKKVLHKRERRARKQAKKLEDQMEEGFCFEQLIVRDHVRRKPTPGRMIKCIDQAHRKECRKCMFDESGKYLVSCGMDKAVKIWDVHNLKLIAELYAHRVGVTSIDVVGTVLAPLSEEEKKELERDQRKQAARQKRRNTDRGRSSDIGHDSSGSPYVSPRSSAMSSARMSTNQFNNQNGNNDTQTAKASNTDFRVISCDANGMLMLWEGIEDSVPAMTLRAHDVTIHDCHFSPDGEWLLTCSEDRSLRIFDAWDGSMLFQYQGHGGAVTTCAWSPNGNTFISGGDFEDPTVRLWDASNAVILMYFNQDKDIAAIEKKNENANSDDDDEKENEESSSEEDEESKATTTHQKKKKKKKKSKKKRPLTEEEQREVERKKRKKSDKRSGRKKAMDLFERKVREGLGVQWMTRTSMLLLCEAYLIVGDPQVGMALFDEMIERKHRATPGLMSLIWKFMRSDQKYLNLREQEKRIEYGEYNKKWKAPVMDTDEPAEGAHANDVAWDDEVLLTTRGKANYVTGRLNLRTTNNPVQTIENKKNTKNTKNTKISKKRRMSKKEKQQMIKEKERRLYRSKLLTVDDSLILGTSRAMPWKRGHDHWGVTEMVRILRGGKGGRNYGIGERETKRRPHATASGTALSDPFLNKDANEDEEEEEDDDKTLLSVASSVVAESGLVVRPMSAPTSRDRSRRRVTLENAVIKSSKFHGRDKHQPKKRWFSGGGGHHSVSSAKQTQDTAQSGSNTLREAIEVIDTETSAPSTVTPYNSRTDITTSSNSSSNPMTKRMRQNLSRDVVRHAFDVAVSRIEYLRVDHLPEIHALREEQRRNDLMRMGIDPDIEAKAEKKRLRQFKRLHKQLNIGQHSSLERIQEVYNRLIVDVPMDAELSREGRMFVMMEHLGNVNNPVTDDQDPRVIDETRTRFMRQWRQIGQVKKYVRRRIKGMDEVLRKLSGVAPWRTDVAPNGANGQSTFMLKTFDHRYGRGHTDWINGLHFCKDGQHVVSASSDRTVRIWDPTTGEQVTTLRGFPGWVNSTTVSEDQEWLIATSDHIVSVWNFREVLERAAQKKSIDHDLAIKREEIARLREEEKKRVSIEMAKEREEARSKNKNKKKNNDEMKVEGDDQKMNTRSSDQRQRDRNEAATRSPYVLEINQLKQEMEQAQKQTRKDAGAAYELHGHCDLVYCAEFNPNRHRIVSASHDMSLRVWQIIPTAPDTMLLPPTTNRLLVHSIRLSWRAPSENGYPITNYLLQIKREDEESWVHERRLNNCMSEHQFYRDTHREFTVKSLRSGSFYQFRLAAINRVGVCAFSPPTPAVRTEPDVPEEIVYKPDVVTPYPRAVILQWVEPNSWGISNRTFELDYRGGGHRLFGDSPVTIVTRDEAYRESESVKRQMKKAALEKAKQYQNRKKKQHAQVEKKKRASMSKEKRKKYLIKEDEKYAQRALKMAESRGKEIDQRYFGLMSAVVRGLIPGNSYQFRVRATNSKGHGKFSPVSISTQTVSLPPQKMKAIYSSHVAPFGCRVSWQKPDARGMPVVEYCIFWCLIRDRSKLRAWKKQRSKDDQHKSRRNALTIDHVDDSMLDAAHVEHVTIIKLRSKAIDLMPFVPDGSILVAHADMEDPKYVNVSGLEPGCDYVFCAACRNRHGYSQLSPISDLVATLPTAPDAPNTPGMSHPSSTGLTLHFIMPHANGDPVSSFYLIIREGDRTNGKCGHPLEFLLSDARPARSDDPALMKSQVLYRDTNDRSHCMIRMGGLSGDQQYGAQISAANTVGLSPYSEMSDTYKTLPATPPKPPRFEPIVDNVTPSSVTFSWTNSDGDGGSPVCGFVIAAAVKTVTKSLGAGSKKRRAQQRSGSTSSATTMNDVLDKDVIVAPDIITNSSIDRRALDTVVTPKGFTVVGLTKVGTTKFTLRPVMIGSYYRLRVAAYSRAGPGHYSPSSHPPIQIPNRNQYIAMMAEKKRKEDHEAMMKSLEDVEDS